MFPIQGASVKEEEDEFVKVLESRAAAAEGKIEVVDINKKKSTVEVTELITLSKVIEDLKAEFPGLVSYKVTFTCKVPYFPYVWLSQTSSMVHRVPTLSYYKYGNFCHHLVTAFTNLYNLTNDMLTSAWVLHTPNTS